MFDERTNCKVAASAGNHYRGSRGLRNAFPGGGVANAATLSTPIALSTFKSDVVKAAVAKAAGIPNVANAQITTTDQQNKVTALDLTGVTDWTGLTSANLPKLTNLKIAASSNFSGDAGIDSGLKSQLTDLTVTDGTPDSISALGLTDAAYGKLEHLDLHNDGLDKNALTGDTAALKGILDENSKLKTLDLSGNKIDDIAGLKTLVSKDSGLKANVSGQKIDRTTVPGVADDTPYGTLQLELLTDGTADHGDVIEPTSVGVAEGKKGKVKLADGKVTWKTVMDHGTVSYEFDTPLKNDGRFSGTVSKDYNMTGAPDHTVRLGGDTRYDSMSSIVSNGWTKSDNVVLASGENYADALVASSLAGQLKYDATHYGAPVVLTNNAKLSDQALAQLKRLKPKTVTIVGGKAAISEDVEDAVKALDPSPDVVRLAGDTRYGTATAVAAHDKLDGVKDWRGGTAVVATGEGFADALSMSSVAAATGMPIFLANPATGLSAAAQKEMRSLRIHSAIIVGGKNAVTAATEKQLQNMDLAVTRLSGATRYETSKAVASYGQDKGLSASKIAFATGENFADALAGSALAGKENALVVLVQDADSPTIDYVKGAFNDKIDRAYVFGGFTVINGATTAAINDAVGLVW